MKNIIITAVCFLTLSVGMANADQVGVQTPTNQFGNEANIAYAGIKASVITSSGTSSHYKNHCAGKCVLYGISVSSALYGGSYVIFQDTTAINNTGTQYLPSFFVQASSTSYNILLDPPARFNPGITSILTHVSDGPIGISVLYLER